jgi:arylamine N-acetyltransferase
MKFTQSHIDEYFDRINLPLRERQKFKCPAGGTGPESQLQSLTTVLHHHLAAVPFENTSLHYSRHRPIELSVQSLFQKIIHRRLGGYCTQVNTLFSELLLALGYHLYTTAARVNQAASAISVEKERLGTQFGTL